MGNCIYNFPKFIHPSDSYEKQICNICYKNKSNDSLFLICNSKPCDKFVCGKCIKNIIENNIIRGEIISTDIFKCPFCKRIGDSNIFDKFCNKKYQKFYNYYFVNKCDKIGYCGCENIDKVTNLSSVCDLDKKNNFICNKCDSHMQIYEKCPKCSCCIEKNGGCNLMTCKCGHQFCWICKNKWGTTLCGPSMCNPIKQYETQTQTRNNSVDKFLTVESIVSVYRFELLKNSHLTTSQIERMSNNYRILMLSRVP
jgi:hypothetical protein